LKGQDLSGATEIDCAVQRVQTGVSLNWLAQITTGVLCARAAVSVRRDPAIANVSVCEDGVGAEDVFVDAAQDGVDERVWDDGCGYACGGGSGRLCVRRI
jgi:hypothetical protein